MGKKSSKNRVKKNPKHKTFAKSIRTRRRTKDVDQIQDELVAVQANPQLNTRSLDFDLPGMGQHYCLCCASATRTHSVHSVWREQASRERLVALGGAAVADSITCYVRCAALRRYFIDDDALARHNASKVHKKRSAAPHIAPARSGWQQVKQMTPAAVVCCARLD